MNDKKTGNQNNTSQTTSILNDYEIEIIKNFSFWTSLFYNIKNKTTQKLLPDANDNIKITNKSTYYIWHKNTFKISIFNFCDSIKNTIFSQPQKNPNTLQCHIIGKNNNISSEILHSNIIIPKNIKISNKI